jgi:quercetin dioxygenase-like cupin family protein
MDMNPAQPIKLGDLVDYQAAAIVSKVIVKQKTGTVTMFAFDAAQELSEHTAPFDALVQVVEGEVEITVSGKPIITKTGEILLLPANQPHALKAITPMKMLLTMIRN